MTWFLLARRKREKMSVRPAMRRIYPAHRAFVKRHVCAFCGSSEAIEFAHLRTAANSGIGYKPNDAFGVPLCRDCHRDAHDRGHETVAREHGKSMEKMFALAAAFVRGTKDKALREDLRLIRTEELEGV